MNYRVDYSKKKAEKHWKKRIELAQKYSANGKLLDIGCSSGYLLNYASKNYKTFGFDVWKKRVKESEMSNVFVGDVENIAIKKKFDVITMFDVIEHLENPEKSLEEVKRIMKKNSVFILSIPVTSGVGWVVHRIIRRFFDGTHKYLERDYFGLIKKHFSVIEELNEVFPVKIYFRGFDFLAFNKIIACRMNIKTDNLGIQM